MRSVGRDIWDTGAVGDDSLAGREARLAGLARPHGRRDLRLALDALLPHGAASRIDDDQVLSLVAWQVGTGLGLPARPAAGGAASTGAVTGPAAMLPEEESPAAPPAAEAGPPLDIPTFSGPAPEERVPPEQLLGADPEATAEAMERAAAEGDEFVDLGDPRQTGGQ